MIGNTAPTAASRPGASPAGPSLAQGTPVELNLIIVALYLVGMLAFGWWGKTRAATTDDYLVAGRRLGPMLFTGTMAAVVLGGASTVGGIGLGYQYGLSGAWLVAAIGTGVVILSVAFAPVLSRLKIYTVSQMLRLRYGRGGASNASSFVMLAYTLMLAATSTGAYASIFVVLFGWDRWLAILAGGLIVLGYSVLGGMWSITLADMAQFIVMTIGMFALNLLPAGIGGVALAAAVAAMMSTASGAIIAAATVMRTDILPIFRGERTASEDGAVDDEVETEEDLSSHRGWVLGLGLVVLLLAILVPDVVAALTIAYDIIVGGLFVAIVGGLLWSRGTGPAAMWSMVAGTLGTLGTTGYLEMNAENRVDGVYANEPIYVGLAASAVVYVLVSLLTPRTDARVMEEWRRRSRTGAPDREVTPAA